MGHDSFLAWFLFPAMPADDRRLILEVGDLLLRTEGRYRRHLETELRLLADADRAGFLRATAETAGSCRVIPFPRPSI